jgi:hypothetical protein
MLLLLSCFRLTYAALDVTSHCDAQSLCCFQERSFEQHVQTCSLLRCQTSNAINLVHGLFFHGYTDTHVANRFEEPWIRRIPRPFVPIIFNGNVESVLWVDDRCTIPRLIEYGNQHKYVHHDRLNVRRWLVCKYKRISKLVGQNNLLGFPAKVLGRINNETSSSRQKSDILKFSL